MAIIPDTGIYVIPEARRELYLRILNDHSNFHEITIRFHFLEDRFPLEKLNAALVWLIQHKVIGKAFIDWFKTSCKGSDLEMLRILLSIVDNCALAPIVAGRNFRT